MSIIKKSHDCKCWWAVRKYEPFCTDGWKLTCASTMIVSIKISPKSMNRNSIRPSYSSRYVSELKMSYYSDTYISMFIVAHLIITKFWKHTISPSKDEQMEKVWYLFLWSTTGPWRKINLSIFFFLKMDVHWDHKFKRNKAETRA